MARRMRFSKTSGPSRDPQVCTWLSFDEIESLGRDGRQLRINGQVVARAGSPVQAAALIKLIRQLRRESAAARRAPGWKRVRSTKRS